MIGAVLAGVAAVSGLVQYYNAEKARKASKAELDKIEATFNAIKPPDYDLSIQDPPQYHMEMLSQPQFASPEASPKFNLNALKPEQFKLIGNMSPEIASYVAEAEPRLVTQTADMKTSREAQLRALRRLQEIGSSDSDPEYAQAVQNASRQAQGESQSRQASIMQDFARRGIAGSGLNLAAQMGGASQAMNRSAMVKQQAATDAYKNRLNALMSGAQLGSQIAQEDVNLQSRNADIINDFNQRMSRNHQDWQNNRASALNNAQQFNLGAAQGIDNMNTGAANNAMQQQQSRLDELTKYGANFAQNERERADRNAQQKYQNTDSQRRYLNELLGAQSNWKAGEREKLNKIRSQQYQDQMDIARGKAGIASQRSANDMSSAQDRNAAIQGVTNAATMYGMKRQDSLDRQNDNYNRANLETFRTTGNWMDDEDRDKYYASYGG